MNHVHRLTLVSLLVSALSACGGGSSSPVVPTPSPSASNVTGGGGGGEGDTTGSCLTPESGTKDDPNAMPCTAQIVNDLTFKLWDSETKQVSNADCTVKIAGNGDISVNIPALPGALSIAHDAPQRHTEYLSTQTTDTSRLRVWSGGSTYNAQTGPYIQIYSGPNSNKVELYALIYKGNDGENYIVECIADLPPN